MERPLPHLHTLSRLWSILPFLMLSLAGSAQTPFVTIWKTDQIGNSADNQITIPAAGEFTYTWVNTDNPFISGSGNGNNETTIDFPQAGTYEVSISPTGSEPFHFIYFIQYGKNDIYKLLEVKNWGTVHWSRFQFNGCANLKVTATDIPDLSGVTDLSFAFSHSGIDEIPNINEWDMSGITDLQSFFAATDFNQPLDKWDVSNVTSMSFMFDGATSFNQPLDSWDVSNVVDISYMFRDATQFNQSLGSWNLASLKGGLAFVLRTAMSCENYSYTLHGWATNPVTSDNVIFSAYDVTYSPDVAPYRDYLIETLNWNFQRDDELGTCSVTLPGSPLTPDADNILYVDINVDVDAAGYTGVGDSWENAVPELADALRWAREQHDGGLARWSATQPLRIYVASGTYLPRYHADDDLYTTDGGRDNSFVLVPNVQLYGGFDPSAGIRTLDDKRIFGSTGAPERGTILSGDFNQDDHVTDYLNHTENAYHVTLVSDDVGSGRIDGVTISGGYAVGATSGPQVFGRTVYRFFGGGMYIISASPELSNIMWYNNSASGGGGIYNSVSMTTDANLPILENVIFYQNNSHSGGGGIRNYVGSLEIRQAVFANNVAGLREDLTSTGPGGAIYTGGNGTSMKITNATFYGNEAIGILPISDYKGGAIHIDRTTATLSNVIIWGNKVEGDTTAPSASISIKDAEVTVANSLIAHADAINIDGTLDIDPRFECTAPGEAEFLRLSACSPAISTGSNRLYLDAGGDPASDVDLAGLPRVYAFETDGVIDIGAYEYQGERLYIEQVSKPDAVPVVYGTAFEQVEGLPTSVAVTLSDGTEVSLPLDSNTENWTLSDPEGGVYDGMAAGAYVFSVPLEIPATECYLNPESLEAEVAIIVTKGKPELSVSWNDVTIDGDEGLSLTYGDLGRLGLSTTDPEGQVTLSLDDADSLVLNLDDLGAVIAQRVGMVDLTLVQEETENFERAALVIPVQVIPKSIHLIATAGQGKIYGADEPDTFSYTLAEGYTLALDDDLTDIVSAVSREAGEDVGIYDIGLTFEGVAAEQYAITFDTDNNAFEITPREVTVTAADKHKVFGSDDPELTYTFTPELVGSDRFSGSLAREEGEAVGEYAITQGNLTLSANYVVSYQPAILKISPAGYGNLSLMDLTSTYDGTAHAVTLTGDLPVGVTVRYRVDGAPGNGATDAGEYEVTAHIDGGSNYRDTVLTAELRILPLEVTVTAADKHKVFGSDDPELTYTFTPELVGSDQFSGTLAREEGEAVGEYAITQGNLTLNANYAVSYQPAILKISPAGYENLSLTDLTSTYDGTAHAVTLAGDLPVGVTVRYTVDGAPGNGATDAGEYEVMVHIDGGSNYRDTVLTAELRILPLEVTVMAADKQKVFGSDDPELTYTVTPELVAGDSFSGKLAREVGEDVGIYLIGPGDLTAGRNYTLLFEGANFVIRPPALPQEITGVTLEDRTFSFDGTERRLSVTGVLPEGVSVSYLNNGRTTVGTQQVSATLSGAGYQTLQLTATLTISPSTRTLVFEEIGERTYGDEDFVLTARASSGEAVTFASSDPSIAEVTNDGRVTLHAAGTTSITATVNENENYSNTPEMSRVLVVRKAQQSITLDAPPSVDRDAGSVQLVASSSSGLPVALSVDKPEVALLEESVLHIKRLGTVRITATQDGGPNHEAAAPVVVTVRVDDPDAALPIRTSKVVSPNGDGVNELLVIEGIEAYPENKVTVFNRNGTVLYEAKGYDNNRKAFSGISTGQMLLPAGTYFYVAEIKENGVWRYEKGWFVLRY